MLAERRGCDIGCALASSDGVPSGIVGTRFTGRLPVPPQVIHGRGARATGFWSGRAGLVVGGGGGAEFGDQGLAGGAVVGAWRRGRGR